MALAREEITVTDEAGNIVTDAQVEVRIETPEGGLGSLAALYSDRDGTVPMANPFTVDGNGVAGFHVVGGAYRIRAFAPGFERIVRYKGIGTAAETDQAEVAPLTQNDFASDSQVRSAAAGSLILRASHIESAAAWVNLTDAATITINWDSFINGSVVLAGNRTLGNPTNAQPGTWRVIRVAGNDGTPRTLSFGNQYHGDLPTLTDITSGKEYIIMILSRTTGSFLLKATQYIP